MEAFNFLVEMGADSERCCARATRSGQYNISPLQQAVHQCDVSGVQKALQSGADPNARDSSGQPLLLLASSKCTVEVVRTLLEYGANPLLRGNENIIECALTFRHPDSARLLIESGARVRRPDWMKIAEWQDPIVSAAGGGHVDLVKGLLERGADPNGTELFGATALQMAARTSNLPLISLLLDAGADPDQLDANGWSPACWARREGKSEAFDLLVQAGADTGLCKDAPREPAFNPSKPPPVRG